MATFIVACQCCCYAQVKSKMLYKAPFKDKPSIFAENIGFIEKSEVVEILDTYPDNYLQIKHNDTIGFMLDFHVEQTPELQNFKTEKLPSLKAKLSVIEKQYEKSKDEELVRLRKIYGEWAYFVQLKGPVIRKMPDRVVLTILGKPDDVNETVGSWGRHEQWVYNISSKETHYYYFENGILTSWQK